MAKYLNINTTDKTDFTTTVLLDGVAYLFRPRYNTRSGWQLGIYDKSLYSKDSNDNSSAKLYGERKLIPRQNFFKFTGGVDTLPTGNLYLYDTEDTGVVEYPTRYNLGQGKRFVLVYFTKEEIDELNSEV